jgi:predicted phage terminase large subunit-like protein
VSSATALLQDPKVREQYAKLKPEQRAAFDWRARWLLKAHKFQLEPVGTAWNIWLMLGGRGSGKTRTSAETVGWWAWEQPNTRWLVSAPTSADLRGTCYEGESGLLAVIPPVLVAKYNSSLHEITLTNGSLIKGIPASEPERFRGGQWHGAWCLPAGTRISMADGTQKAVEDVAVGDKVLTRFGAHTVSASGLSNNPNELVTIDCGETSLTLTVDHPILSNDRWIPAGDLKAKDSVWAISGSKGATPTASCGNATSGLSRPDGLFTTRTRTHTTTTSPTCKPCHEANTCNTTQQGAKETTRSVLRRGLRWLRYALQNPQYAYAATTDLLRTQRGRLVSFAHGNALNNGGATSLFPKSVIAWFARKNTQQLNAFNDTAAEHATTSRQCAHTELRQLEVLSAVRSPNQPTYNLTVDTVHEYIANGIVVHNCDELAAWEYLQEAWDMIQFAVRLGSHTRVICSTTPKPKPVVMDLIDRNGDDVVVTTASTYVNIKNLAPSFQKQILQYEGTKLGRQEIHAEIIDPEESGIVKRDWFKLWPDKKPFPRFEYIVQSVDCAASEKTHNDPTAHITFGVFKPEDGGMCAMVIDCWQDHLQYPDLRPKILDEYETVYGEGKSKKRVDLLLIEDKSAGISLIQDLRRAGVPVQAYNPGRADKIQRLSIVANIIKAGRVWIPESGNRKGFVRDWAEGMVSQVCSFPEGTAHDDFVDAMSQALRYLRDAGWLTIDFPSSWVDDEDYADANPRQRENPYAV